MHRALQRAAIALLCAAAFLPLMATTALAHGHITVGDYELVIGFKNEPAYQSEPNGLDLTVTNTKTGEKVAGLADTLQAELSFGGSTKALKLRPQFGKEGSYTADTLPTQSGDYTWHIFGDIQGTPVDITMTSSPETFSAVRAKSEVAFPAAEPTADELQGRLATLQQTATVALAIGALGIVLGAIGIVVALRARAGAQPAAVQR